MIAVKSGNLSHLRCFALACALVPVACGGTSNPPTTTPAPAGSIAPVTSGTENIMLGAVATTAPLPSIGGIYAGEILLPPGSGTAKLTFSLNAPSGVPALTELTPTPQVAYITIAAQSPLTLAMYPGLNLTVPAPYMVIDMWVNYYVSGAWKKTSQPLGWPSTSGVAAMCFEAQGGAVSLQSGQSLYLGINGDDVLPTPITSGTPPPCPQT